MKYQAVIFDLFGTLVNNFSIQQNKSALASMATVLALPEQEFIHYWMKETWQMRARGEFKTLRENVEYICHVLGCPVEAGQVERALQIWLAFTRHSLTPRPGVIEILKQLKALGYKTGIISDCSEEVQTRWQETPFATLTDATILSCEVGMKKPDARMYLLMCDRLAIFPQHCLYVGDGSSHELSGAAQVGMHPLLLEESAEDVADAFRPDAENWQGKSIRSLQDVFFHMG